MLIFPAIDIRGGKCVRLLKGDFAQETVFSDDPAAMARKWQQQGAQFLHLVDLDGALAGKSQNLATVKAILAAVTIPVELGGGIRTMENVDEVLTLGVRRVILGSVAVRNPDLVKAACAKYGDRVVVGIDAKDGIVAVDGWGVSGNVQVGDLAREMGKAGVRTIIYTDIARDGTLEGVNVEATARLARESGIQIVASGGVKSVEDIRALKPYEKDGIEGVIVGKSIYMGTLEGVNVEATARLARESGIQIVASGGVKSVEDIRALKPYEKDGIEGVIVGKSIYMGTLDLQEAIEIAGKEG